MGGKYSFKNWDLMGNGLIFLSRRQIAYIGAQKNVHIYDIVGALYINGVISFIIRFHS